MSAYYNPSTLEKISKYQLVLDTNILSSCSSNKDYLKSFLTIFKMNPKLIDPVVKLEFFRNASTEKLLKEKEHFLEYNNFHVITDAQDNLERTIENAYKIARIYSHYGNSKIPLGDILIASRLKDYCQQQLLVTLDKGDFSTVLFDRIGVVSIEKISKNNNNILEHIVILHFNDGKYEQCLEYVS